jgi:hypothetical protein
MKKQILNHLVALLITANCLLPIFSAAQIGVGINYAGASPNSSALLDIDAGTGIKRGLLIPRIALVSSTDATTIASPATSLMVYNTATAGSSPNNVMPGYYYWNGSKWISISGGSGGNDWSLLGNAGTVDGTNFIGTTDNIPFNIRVNNQKAGRVDPVGPTFLGYQAGNSNTSASNTGIGSQSLYSNTTANQNTAMGTNALYSQSFSNSGVVWNSDNVAIGYNALYSNQPTSTGEAIQNTAVGSGALVSNTTGSRNTATGTNTLYGNTTGTFNTAIGRNSLYYNTTGNYNTALGVGALLTTATVSNNTALGFDAQVPVNTNSNQVRIGDANVTYAGVQVAWTITSDKRWKTDIQNSNLGLDFITMLRPVSYIRRNDADKKIEYGFIAQELEEALNKSGIANTGIISKDDKGMYGVRYNDLLSPIVRAIQELSEKNKEQQKMLEAQKKLIEKQQKVIDDILKNKNKETKK